jgi:hypothetical protein
MAKHAARAGAGAVGFFNPMRVDMAHEIFVGGGDGGGGGGSAHQQSVKRSKDQPDCLNKQY